MDLNEAKFEEVEIEDFDFDTVETLMYFFYNEDIQDQSISRSFVLLTNTMCPDMWKCVQHL
mgnify:CR=1 FL=1